MKLARLSLLVLVSIGVAFALSGCGRYAPAFIPPLFGTHQADYVGVWVHTEHDSSYGSTLTLNSDGTAQLSGMPGEVFNPWATTQSTSVARDFFSTSGTWSMIKETSFGSPEISLSMKYVPYVREALQAALIYNAGPGTRSLNFVLGDPDEGDFYEFSR
jgi:hypothetical protein